MRNSEFGTNKKVYSSYFRVLTSQFLISSVFSMHSVVNLFRRKWRTRDAAGKRVRPRRDPHAAFSYQP